MRTHSIPVGDPRHPESHEPDVDGPLDEGDTNAIGTAMHELAQAAFQAPYRYEDAYGNERWSDTNQRTERIQGGR